MPSQESISPPPDIGTVKGRPASTPANETIAAISSTTTAALAQSDARDNDDLPTVRTVPSLVCRTCCAERRSGADIRVALAASARRACWASLRRVEADALHAARHKHDFRCA
jgi:hypothetical protein